MVNDFGAVHTARINNTAYNDIPNVELGLGMKPRRAHTVLVPERQPRP